MKFKATAFPPSLLAAGLMKLLDEYVDVDDTAPDVVVVAMGGELTVVPEARAKWPDAKLVVLAHKPLEPDEVIVLFTHSKVSAFCLETGGVDVLRMLMELAFLGQVMLPPEMLAYISQPPTASSNGIAVVIAGQPLGQPVLSGREHAVLTMLRQGASNKEIARRLGVAEATIKVHVKSILRKLRLKNRTQAAMWQQQILIGADGAEA